MIQINENEMPGIMHMSRQEAQFTAKAFGFYGSSGIGDIPDNVHALNHAKEDFPCHMRRKPLL